MFSEVTRSLRPAIVLLALFTLVTGVLYPLAVTGIAQVVMHRQANGSLIERGGQVIGSELIAQGFAAPRYFHPRPSAAGKGYDASNSAATNLAPGAKDLRDAIAGRIKDLRGEGVTGAIPADLVTTSGSGLDPEISPAAALAQAPRVAKARGIGEPAVRDLIARETSHPLLGIIGEPRVNVLALNRALDRKGEAR